MTYLYGCMPAGMYFHIIEIIYRFIIYRFPQMHTVF